MYPLGHVLLKIDYEIVLMQQDVTKFWLQSTTQIGGTDLKAAW